MRKSLGIGGLVVLLVLAVIGVRWIGDEDDVVVSSPRAESEPGVEEAASETVVAGDEPTSSERTALAPGEDRKATSLWVEVRVREDGSAVPNVGINLGLADSGALGGRSGEGRTDEDGVAYFELEHGTIVHRVSVAPGPKTTGFDDWVHHPIATGEEMRRVVSVSRGASLSGTVVDVEGRPVGGAVVRGWCRSNWSVDREPRPAPDREVTTDESGRFTVPHLGRELVLDATAPGMACLTRIYGELAPGVDGEGIELVLGPASRIEGRVLDPRGEPLEGVAIRSLAALRRGEFYATPVPDVWRADPLSVRTTSGAGGTFELADLAAWSYTFLVRHPGFRPWRRSHAPADGFLEIRLEWGLELTGGIRGANGRPLPGAAVRIAGEANAKTRTDEAGTFRLEGLVEDPAARLYVAAAGHAVLVHQPLAIGAETPNRVELRLEPERVIAGRVVDVAGEGVPGANVGIEGDRIVDYGGMMMMPTPTWEWSHGIAGIVCDEDGRFRLDQLYAGAFQVEALHPDDPSLRVVVGVESGTEDLRLVLDPEAVFEVRLEGRVTDALDGEPVPSFVVTPMIPNYDGSGSSGAPRDCSSPEGTFEVRGLDPGPIEINVTADGYARWYLPRREYAAGRHRLEVALFPERTLHLRVVSSGGAPLHGWTVVFRDVEGEALWIGSEAMGLTTSRRLDEKGEAVVRGLPARLVTLEVRETPRAPETTFDLDLTRPPTGVQQFIVETRELAELRIVLLTVSPATEFEGRFEIAPEILSQLIEVNEDLAFLDAPSFTVSVRDGGGRIRAKASGTRGDDGTWSIVDDRSLQEGFPMPGTDLHVPLLDLDVEIRAEGHDPLDLSFPASDLATPESRRSGWAVVLRRSS